MITPPILLDDAYRKIHNGIDELGDGSDASLQALSKISEKIPGWLKAHLTMEHTIPSPSTVTECRYKLWNRAKKVPPDSESPRGWKIRRAMGIISEPYWLAVLEAGELKAEAWSTTLTCGPHMTAHPDAVIKDDFLFEFKSTTGVGYKRLVESLAGVRAAEWSHYMQAQLYMYAAKYKWLLYLCSPPDFSLTQSMIRQRKKYKGIYELPPVYLEWIPLDTRVVEEGLQRAEWITDDIKKDTPPLREYSGVEFKMDGKTRTFPCGYCLYLKTCNEGAPDDRYTIIR